MFLRRNTRLFSCFVPVLVFGEIFVGGPLQTLLIAQVEKVVAQEGKVVAQEEKVAARAGKSLLYSRQTTNSYFDAPPMSRTYAEIVYSGRDSFRKAIMAFRHRMVDDYLEQTNDPKVIQEEATDFLEKTLKTWSGARGSESWRQLKIEGESLIAAGSKDPIVQLHYGFALSETGDTLKASELYRRSIEGFQESNYPARCTIYGPLRLALELDVQSSPEFNEAADYYSFALAYWLKFDRRFTGEDIRVVFSEIRTVFDKDRRSLASLEKWHWIDKKFSTTVEVNDEIAPWLRHMIGGALYQNMAWINFSKGGPPRMDERRWSLYHHQLNMAGFRYFQAWKENKKFPESASRLISVSMAGGHPVSTDEWFDRSFVAEPDWTAAHENFLFSRRPQWGGSTREMLIFGRECLNRKRFNTLEPMFFVQAVLDSQEEGSHFSAWADEELVADLKRCLLGMVKASEPNAIEANYYRTMLACLASQLGQYKLAAEQFDLLGDQVSDEAFDWVGQAYSIEYTARD